MAFGPLYSPQGGAMAFGPLDSPTAVMRGDAITGFNAAFLIFILFSQLLNDSSFHSFTVIIPIMCL